MTEVTWAGNCRLVHKATPQIPPCPREPSGLGQSCTPDLRGHTSLPDTEDGASGTASLVWPELAGPAGQGRDWGGGRREQRGGDHVCAQPADTGQGAAGVGRASFPGGAPAGFLFWHLAAAHHF